jgi:UDP-N-acetylmuramate dehydrogenase
MDHIEILSNEPLAPITTMEVGGSARFLVFAYTHQDLIQALDLAADQDLPLFVLGGGSNTFAHDDGFDGVVICPRSSEIRVVEEDDKRIRLKVNAGHDWDSLVAHSVSHGWSGIECLSGIPGRVGAAPIQNIGAYGQELSHVLRAVHVLGISDRLEQTIAAGQCGLGYRQSHFKGIWRGKNIITAIEIELRKESPEPVKYPELKKEFESNVMPNLRQIREAVLSVRRRKSMVYDPKDSNHRSCGSFFLNPILSRPLFDKLLLRAKDAGIDMRLAPQYVAQMPDGAQGIKLSAAWLMEQAGFQRGFALGKAALSSGHCLAVINPGDASAGDILALVNHIRDRIREVYGIQIVPEPVFLARKGLHRWEDNQAAAESGVA